MDTSTSDKLNALLMPGTTDDVRARYFALADMAAERDFGLLEDEIVVLDTETTGLNFSQCKLIQISAARMVGREVRDTFDTFINPGSEIPPFITQLTDISDADVADAPTDVEAVADLIDFVGGAPVLAHNANFDRTFIELVRGGKNVSDIWIDTLALSRIALPRLSSHRLADMADAFGVSAVTHNAFDDVLALCGMWRIILCGLAQLPAGLINTLADMHEDFEWSYRPIFKQLSLGTTPERLNLLRVREELLHQDSAQRLAAAAAEARRYGFDADDDERSYEPVSDARVADEFSETGVAGAMYVDFETRPEQVVFAQHIAAAMNLSRHQVIEAGTGIGKSVGYLLPAVLFGRQNGVPIGVATKTNTLTDQLITHELPALSEAIDGGVRYYALKGYEHYPCLLKLERGMRAQLPVEDMKPEWVAHNAQEMMTALAVSAAYASQTIDGDLDTLGIRWDAVPRDFICTTSHECIKNKCPHFLSTCMVHGTRRRAATGNIVVTNHSLLMRDFAAGSRIFSNIKHWIIDEAHSFESEARKQWARQVSSSALAHGLSQLGTGKEGVIHQIIKQSAKFDDAGLIIRLGKKAESEAAALAELAPKMFESIHALGKLAYWSNSYDQVNLWIDDEKIRSSRQWDALVETALPVIDVMKSFNKCAADLKDVLAVADEDLAQLWSRTCEFMTEMASALELIVAGADKSWVYSADLRRSTRYMDQESLRAERLDVGQVLGEKWLPELDSVTFSSATISVGGSFAHFEKSVGMDLQPAHKKFKGLQLKSSFDYDRHMAVIVPKDMPAPNEASYLDSLIETLFDTHIAMGGSVLTLFTNRRDMEYVFERLEPRLQTEGLTLMMQGSARSIRQINRQFKSNKETSLLALKSFWEGFDAAGDTLRCVVIAKLPFSRPNDPLSQERNIRDERSWFNYSLPEAVISVKQAAGRLIRTQADSGIVMICDSRVLTKSYGKTFLKSLESKNQKFLLSKDIKPFIQEWNETQID